MKVVVFAYHNMGIIGLEGLKKAGYEILAIFSHENDSQENCWFDSVQNWGEQHHIPVYCPERVNKPEWVQVITSLAPSMIFSFYYRYMLSQDILNIPPEGAYNLHGSLLPAYRGRCPVNWVLLKGEKRSGVTLHHMVHKADAGDIVAQKAVEIHFNDNARTLYDKLCTASTEMLAEVLPLMKVGKAPRMPQDLSAGSYFGGRKPEDGRIDWQWPALRIYNLIRAVTDPYPGAFALLPDGEKVMIWWGLPDDMEDRRGFPGTLLLEGNNVFVLAGQGRILLRDVEIAGSRLKDHNIFAYFEHKEGMTFA